MDTLHKILDAMWKQGYSDADFCKKVGINKSAVTDWKKGKTKSYMKHLSKIADVLGVSIDYLTGTSPMSENPPTPEQQDEFSELLKDCSLDEREQVKKYIEFIKSQRKKIK